jgi:hypothetical protein
MCCEVFVAVLSASDSCVHKKKHKTAGNAPTLLCLHSVAVVLQAWSGSLLTSSLMTTRQQQGQRQQRQRQRQRLAAAALLLMLPVMSGSGRACLMPLLRSTWQHRATLRGLALQQPQASSSSSSKP